MIQKPSLEKFADVCRTDLNLGANWTDGWFVHLLKSLPSGGLTPELELADMSGHEADFKGYEILALNQRGFSGKAWVPGVGWLWYFNDLLGYLFDPDGSGADSNSIVGFFVDNGELVACGELAAPVTIEEATPALVFKLGFRVFTDA